MSIENELQQFISEKVLISTEEAPVGVDESLMSSGRVDSMGLLTIVSYIQDQYQVDVLAVGGPEDFETVQTLAETIRKHIEKNTV